MKLVPILLPLAQALDVQKLLRSHWTWLAPLVLLPSLWAGHYFYAASPLSFDSESWATYSQDDHRHARARMADRLVASGKLLGKTRPQVIALLGKPATRYAPGENMSYNLGYERGFMSIDNEWLDIHFGKDGRVIRAEIVHG